MGFYKRSSQHSKNVHSGYSMSFKSFTSQFFKRSLIHGARLSAVSFLPAAALVSVLLVSCGGSGNKEELVVPEDLPPICRGIDFVAQPDMREVCGVRTTRYKAYKNIPQTRYLIVPKGATLVRKSDGVSLRLPNTLPEKLDESFVKNLEWTQEARMEYLKNKMIYREFRPDGGSRIKMFKLQIPLKDQSMGEVCFNVPDKPELNDRQTSVMGNKLDPLDCADFDAILAKHEGGK